MASTNVNSSWEKIQHGVKDTERLIGQKEYNSAMVKARQTLEFMVRLLAERACVVDNGDLMEMIDTLYQNRWISKGTCEHYHKIRIIGNKAAHEGDNNAYNANQAYHMLSQEVYTFANDYRNAQRGSRPGRSANRSTGQSSGNRPAANRPPSQSQMNRSRKRQPQKRAGFTIYDLLKLLIPILCIILLVLVIKLVKPAKEDTSPSTSAPVSTEQTQPEDQTTAPSETEPPAAVYKTTDVLNVRPAPNTTDDRIGQLEAGARVDYVRDHDEEWAVIMYNGQEAYVAKRFLTTE